jgi:minor extracellular serine protease Vpr
MAELFGNIDLSTSKQTTVIVELIEESIVEAKHKGKKQNKSMLASERNRVVQELQDKVGSTKVNREYDYVFSGFSVDLPANQIPQLLAIPGVKAVYPDVEYTVTSDQGPLVDKEAYSPHMMESAPFIGANQVWNELGYTGEGVTIAVIDTGVDYTHPDLTHAFGDYKGWDFVDNDADPQETQAGDPGGEATAHGTHVSGTIAANGLIKGVAPDATLLGYRVLGPGGSGTTTNVVAGIERALQDGAQVMNLSLGNSLNNADWATSIALDWAMAEGVVVATSNGNSGPDNWTVGSPGTSRQAISVGATQLPYNVYNSTISTISTTSDVYSYPTATVMGFVNDEDLLALDGITYEFVDVGLGYPEDFEGKDINGKIALISRGLLPFVTKAENAKNAGAVGAIIYNHLAGEIPYVIPGMAVPTIKLTNADGQDM